MRLGKRQVVEPVQRISLGEQARRALLVVDVIKQQHAEATAERDTLRELDAGRALHEAKEKADRAVRAAAAAGEWPLNGEPGEDAPAEED